MRGDWARMRALDINKVLLGVHSKSFPAAAANNPYKSPVISNAISNSSVTRQAKPNDNLFDWQSVHSIEELFYIL